MKTIVYIISDVDDAPIFEQIFSDLSKKGYKLAAILLNGANTSLNIGMLSQGIETHTIECRSKTQQILAIVRVRSILRKLKADVVHCHLLTANLVGLTAAKLAGVKARIYTRHHSTEHHVYHKSGVKLDKLSNRLATKIIAISRGVELVLRDWEHVPVEKIILIPHGFPIQDFQNLAPLRVSRLRSRYGLDDRGPVIGVISRFVEWKGIQYIIPAFAELLKTYPKASLLLLNAKGDYGKEIQHLLDPLPKESYQKVSFEKDIAGMYKLMDVFVHVPINEYAEAFGQIYVEALAASTPSIFTLSGIAPDFIKHEENALVVPFRNSDSISQALHRLLADVALQEKLRMNGPLAAQSFTLEKLIHRLQNLYDNN